MRWELYGAVTNRGANTVRINLSILLGQMMRKSDPERSGSDLRTHVVCLFPKNRSELTGKLMIGSMEETGRDEYLTQVP